MKKIVRENDRKVLLDVDQDECLYDSQEAYSKRANYLGKSSSRGVDLYVHFCEDGTPVYYELHWSRWQGEISYIDPITEEEAQQFIESNFDVFDEEKIERLEKLGLINMAELQ